MTGFTITLTTSDGQTLSIPCAEGEDIVSAAEKADIYLPAQCRAGTCGMCLGTCQEGRHHHGEYNPTALTDGDRAAGKILLCRTYPESPMTIALPHAYDQIGFTPVQTRQGEITTLTYLTDNTLKLDLRLLPDEEGNLSFEFEPGQFVEVTSPEGITRAYSMANAPNWEGTLEFLITLRDKGAFSSYLANQAAPGQSLWLHGPKGTFTLHDHGLRPRYFVAGGCGLASIISMLRRMAEWQEPHQVKLFFGVRHESEIFFRQELATLAAEYPNLSYHICVSRPSENWREGYRGSVVTAFEEALKKETASADVYVCGSERLIDGVREVAEWAGVPKNQVVYERLY